MPFAVESSQQHDISLATSTHHLATLPGTIAAMRDRSSSPPSFSELPSPKSISQRNSMTLRRYPTHSRGNSADLPSVSQTRNVSAAYTSISSIPPSIAPSTNFTAHQPRKTPRPPFRTPSEVQALRMASPSVVGSPKASTSRKWPAHAGDELIPSHPSDIILSRHRAETIENTESQFGDDRVTTRRMATFDGSDDRDEEDLNVQIRRDLQKLEMLMQGHQRMGSIDPGPPSPVLSDLPVSQYDSKPKSGPLILLHVTILPAREPIWLQHTFRDVVPPHVLDNWSLLWEQLNPTIMTRGVLISHPGDEYDLLEERLLEALELCTPRVLSDGHFLVHGVPGDFSSDSPADTDSGVGSSAGGSKRSSLNGDMRQSAALIRMSGASSEGSDICCSECAAPLRLPGRGTGSGTRRWDVRFYASNGLVRAGAWGACWHDMERVDVEIEPWIPLDLRRELDRKVAEEKDKMREERLSMENIVAQARLDVEMARVEADGRVQEAETKAEICEERARQVQFERDTAGDDTRKIQDLEEELALEVNSVGAAHAVVMLVEEKLTGVGPSDTSKSQDSDPSEMRKTPSQPTTKDFPKAESSKASTVPLSTLLKNYLYLLATSRRNITICCLALLVMFMTLRSGLPTIEPSVLSTNRLLLNSSNDGDVLVQPQVLRVVTTTAVEFSMVAVISTATVLSTEIQTLTSTAVSTATETVTSRITEQMTDTVRDVVFSTILALPPVVSFALQAPFLVQDAAIEATAVEEIPAGESIDTVGVSQAQETTSDSISLNEALDEDVAFELTSESTSTEPISKTAPVEDASDETPAKAIDDVNAQTHEVDAEGPRLEQTCLVETSFSKLLQSTALDSLRPSIAVSTSPRPSSLTSAIQPPLDILNPLPVCSPAEDRIPVSPTPFTTTSPNPSQFCIPSNAPLILLTSLAIHQDTLQSLPHPPTSSSPNPFLNTCPTSAPVALLPHENDAHAPNARAHLTPSDQGPQ
ncbi:hypothetical protein EJ06DRAFT_534175 [Trichodelitschia bisporula]|uniref:Uncharacterized protein n=1 Tax=Trichodelitschia bisporula TaxID=703511 RepID=A0A6G1HKM8_9PEZI|nr:hypothetical protein EJ06DRAFT_534175 [Trichodelitschia bisporula]